ncbi:MAG: hypothetical protein K2F89_06285, partial [Treponemataceae bacterium]|nr:hypothetical protein [Treponemataceae bacterium]
VIVEGEIQDVAIQKTSEQNSLVASKNAKPLELKASKFEMLKSEENDESEMTIRLTELSNLGSISAANVSFEHFNAPDFIK